MPSGHVYFNPGGRSILVEGVSVFSIIIKMFIEMNVFNANSLDPGLCCQHMK